MTLGEREVWIHGGGDLRKAADEVVGRGEAGALLKLGTAADSGRTTDCDLANLEAAWEATLSMHSPGLVARRMGWNQFQAITTGNQQDLVQRTVVMLEKLCAESSSATYCATLTPLIAEEVERTFCCDPGYDLDKLAGSYLVWVDPYPGEDWRESQRYPTTKHCWQALA